MNLNPPDKESFQTILDCLTAADGGLELLRLRCLLENMTQQANDGVKEADRVLEVMRQFARMIETAQTVYKS